MKYFDLQTWATSSRHQGSSGTSGGVLRGPAIATRSGISSRFSSGGKYAARVDAANQVTDATARARAWADLEADLMGNDPPVATYADATLLALYSRNFGCWSGAPGVHAYRLEENGLDLAAVCKK